jgi:predicted homoserine dehydrogenase-like protein
MELIRKLQQRQKDNNPVSVGIIGCGQMGSGLAHTINNILGMQVNALADINPSLGVRLFAEMGYPSGEIIVTEKAGEANDALRKGRFVVTPDALLLTDLERIEANVEVTGATDVGARVALTSIEKRKPIIMLNVETDVTIGYLLNRKARANNALYTVASGDEPGVCKMLWEQALLMGFEVVCIGKGKNNEIDFDATPGGCAAEAASKDMNPKILASFKDGTKTMVEMAAVSNSTGLLPDVPGMHGPKVELEDLLGVFRPKADGGIFNTRGTVDYSTGSIAPGIFVIVYSADKRIQKDMKFITHADGPYYLLFRPYHLCDLETPQSIAEAVLLNEVTVTADNMNSEVCTIAKRNIKAGEKIKGIGSADIFGKIYSYRQARQLNAIPIGIAENGVALTDIAKGALLTSVNLLPDRSTFIFRLREEQDKLLMNTGINIPAGKPEGSGHI